MNAPTLLIGLGGVGSKIVERVSGLITPEQREYRCCGVGYGYQRLESNQRKKSVYTDNPNINQANGRRVSFKKYICEGYMVPRQQNVEQKAFDRRSGTGQIDFAPGF